MPAEEKTVDIDTSGPGAEVQLEENKKPETNEVEVPNETTTTDDNKSADTPEKSSEQLDVRTDENNQEQSEEKKEEVKEEPKKDEHEKYSDSVQKRIAKLTKRYREAERQREEALDYARRIQKERDDLTSKVSNLDQNYTSEMEGRVKSSLLAAQQKLIAAREADDKKAEVEALTSISQLGYEQARVAELKTKLEMEKKAAAEKPAEQKQPFTPSQAAPDPKAEDWASKNEWFGKDSAMTYTAFDLHRKLTEEEGFDPQSEEYYKEIDKRIRVEFPHKFDKPVDSKPTSKPTQTVASATRSTKTSRKTVKLTPSQVAIAKKLGVPLEEYAKQLMNTKEV